MKEQFDKKRLNQITPDELEAHGLIVKSAYGSKKAGHGYCCVYPSCNSGNGPNQSGALDFDEKGDHWEHYCHSCQTGGDNIKLFQAIWQTDFVDACRRASEMFGIPIIEGDSSYRPKRTYTPSNLPPPDKPVGKQIVRYKMNKETKPEELPLIQDDIKQAQANLSKLPEKQRRGLKLDTLKYFGCGYLEKWIHPVNRLANENLYPSRRIIIPTDGNAHYHALALDCDRPRMKPKYHKMHAGAKRKCFNEKDLNQRIVIVSEGEVDMMSLFEARYFEGYPNHPFSFKDGYYGMVSIYGAANWKLVLMPYLDSGYDVSKQFILLLDNDYAGRTQSAALKKALEERGRRVVVKFLVDYLTDEQRKKFPDTKDEDGNIVPAKVDANDILTKLGNYVLRTIIKKIIDEAEEDFDKMRKAEADAHAPINLDIAEPDHNPALAAMKHDALEQDYNKIVDTKTPEITAEPTLTAQNPEPVTEVTGSEVTVSEISAPVQNEPMPEVIAPVQKTPSVDTDAAEWQTDNGTIAPDTLTKINNAKTYLQSFTADNLTPAVAAATKTKRALALCRFYDFNMDIYIRFLATVDKCQLIAENNLQQTKLAGGEFVTPDETALAWKHFSVRDLKADVDKIFRQVGKAHKEFVKQEQARLAEQAHLAKIAERNAALLQNRSRLEELRAADRTSERDEEIIRLITETVEWKVNRDGTREYVKTTAANLSILWDYDPDLDGLIGYEKFNHVVTFLKQAPWRSDPCIGEQWTDADDAQLRLFMRTRYVEFGNDKFLYDAVVKYSRQLAYHEIIDGFFAGLPQWDGKERAETIFIKFLSAEDTKYHRAVTMNWLFGALARLFFEGCDYQTCLVLLGGQRIGKSKLLRMLAGAFGVNPRGKDWHVSLADSVDDSHALDAIMSGWLIELEENISTKKADVDALKRFISAEKDTRRVAFGRHAEIFKRHCVMAITTNNKSFLRDTTGNARFAVIKCTEEKFKQVDGMTPEYIRQVLAEVIYKFKQLIADVDTTNPEAIAEKLRMPRDLQIEGEKYNEQYLQDDGLMSELKAWADMKIPPAVIWNLFNREERAEFCRRGQFVMHAATDELIMRRRLGSPRNIEQDIVDIRSYLRNEKFCRVIGSPNTDNSSAIIAIKGSEYRQHVCIAEINNEAFAIGDRRKNSFRINELFNALEGHGWTLGKRIDREPVYHSQKRVLWRDADNIPEDAQPQEPEQQPDYDFGGEPISPNEVTPFDPEDMPF